VLSFSKYCLGSPRCSKTILLIGSQMIFVRSFPGFQRLIIACLEFAVNKTRHQTIVVRPCIREFPADTRISAS
jgi:hypothetical protein